jgi:ABC-type transport system substrate-binding protein
MHNRIHIFLTLAILLLAGGCSNNPFPKQDAEFKVRYIGFDVAPKTLDPAVGYTSGMGSYIRAANYECLLEYHYTKVPYELIPGLAEEIPEAVSNPDGSVTYNFKIRPGIYFHNDECFRINGTTNTTRELTASDFEFELMRTADPIVICPVITPLSNIAGMHDFMDRLRARRKADSNFEKLPVTEQYKAIGPIKGVKVSGKYGLQLTLKEPYPQILYWLAMPFTAAVPWEAVVYYNGENGKSKFRDHPVGTGPYYLKIYDKEFRAVLERNPTWYGIEHPDWKAPAATYPTNGPPEYAGKPLAFIERFEFRREKESVSSFSKFMQGYYDSSGIVKENFDNIVVENDLSPEMKARGIRLAKNVALHIGYIGFNMNDPDVGSKAGKRGRKLRQAMSTAVDIHEYSRIFMNGRGIPAQSPIPPGIFGYDPDYVNPYRTTNLERARKLLDEAGYPNGIDPKTSDPLKLNFDVMGTNPGALMAYKFYINAWRSIGLNVALKATNYNQFQDKVRNDAYQIFTWGWGADYPDPENFLFLLYSKMARTNNNGPNTANFANKDFDKLFMKMRCMTNNDTRYKICRKMVKILENECPWIPLIHNEDYALYHHWLKNVKPAKISAAILKYEDIDPALRYAYQQKYNKPIMWPLYVGLLLLAIIITPAVITFIRERQ